MLTRSNIIAFLAYSRRWESKTKKIFQISKKLLKKCREVYSNLKVTRRHSPMGYNFFASPQHLLFRHQSKYHKNLPAKNDPNT